MLSIVSPNAKIRHKTEDGLVKKNKKNKKKRRCAWNAGWLGYCLAKYTRPVYTFVGGTVGKRAPGSLIDASSHATACFYRCHAHN